MDTQYADAVIATLKKDLAELDPFLEGYADDLRLDIEAPAREKVTALQSADLRRKSLLEALVAIVEQLRAAIVALLNDGYPGLKQETASQEVLADLDDQLFTLTKARSRLSAQVSSLGISFGPEEKI